MRWFASLRSAKKYCASVSNTAGGHGIRPYVFCFRPQGENSTFFIIYSFLFLILRGASASRIHHIFYLLSIISYLNKNRGAGLSPCAPYKWVTAG